MTDTVTSKILTTSNVKAAEPKVNQCKCYCATSSTTQDEEDDGTKHMVKAQFLKDEDDAAFVPYTHTKCVFNSNNAVLDDILTQYNVRIEQLEQGIAPSIKVADNLITDSGAVALSARQGLKINTLISNTAGDAYSDGSKLIIKDGAVVANHLAANSVTTEKLDDDAVTADKLADGAVIGSNICMKVINKDHLDDDLQQTIDDMESMQEWRETTETRITALEEAMEQHQADAALILEQNQFLLGEHHRYKKLEAAISIYNVTTGADVQNTISVDDIRMSGLQLNYKWHFFDTKDTLDYTPSAFNITALIKTPVFDEDGDAVLDASGNPTYTDSSLVLTTDKGMNNIQQVLRMRALVAGSKITVRATLTYCWLDWTNDYQITITA